MLRDENAIEGVTMVKRKLRRREDVLRRDGKDVRPERPYRFADERSDPIGQRQLSEGVFDADLPDARHGQHDRVGVSDGVARLFGEAGRAPERSQPDVGVEEQATHRGGLASPPSSPSKARRSSGGRGASKSPGTTS